MKRHLLEAADLDRTDATLVLDTAAQIEQALAGREVKKLPTLRGRPRSRRASRAARTERPEKRTSSTRTTSRSSMPPSGSTVGSSARTPRSRRSSR